jgi:hypothetical protein
MGGIFARSFAVNRLRLGANDACGLISRCGHYRPPHCNVASQAKTGLAGIVVPKLALTERFGQDIFLSSAP